MLYKVSYQATYLALWFCNRDTMIQQLQEQISDLSLYLEEERVNHRQTKQKVSPWVISELTWSTKISLYLFPFVLTISNVSIKI